MSALDQKQNISADRRPNAVENRFACSLLFALEKDAPVPRAIGIVGYILCRPVLGGPHHQHVRI